MEHNPLGFQQERTVPPDLNILFSDKFLLEGRGVIDKDNAYDGGQPTGYEYSFSPGTPMAKITASGLWVPCKRTQVNGTSGAATAVVVDDARFFKVGDVITIGADAAITIAAIDYDTNTLTIASTTVADNEVVFCSGLPGSEICRGILNEYLDLYEEESRAPRAVGFSHMVFGGCVDKNRVLGDLPAILAVTNYLDHIIWGDEVGQTE